MAVFMLKIIRIDLQDSVLQDTNIENRNVMESFRLGVQGKPPSLSLCGSLVKTVIAIICVSVDSVCRNLNNHSELRLDVECKQMQNFR